MPFSCSARLNSCGRSVAARASASGGTMPASMTAAMILQRRRVGAAEPGRGERVRRLVDRATHVERHHQAEHDAEQDGRAAGHAVEGILQLGR